jgi:arylsulfatase A-like enzyme
VWAFWDFLPTAAELAGVSVPSGIDGTTVMPTLTGQGSPKPHDFLYWEFHEQGSKQAVRTGQWKAVRLRPGGPIELYDIKSDPGETKNVASEHPDVVARVEAYLKTARTENARWPLSDTPAKAKVKAKAKGK